MWHDVCRGVCAAREWRGRCPAIPMRKAGAQAKEVKVFCFFFSKKKCLLPYRPFSVN
jgi:hypothetical protein